MKNTSRKTQKIFSHPLFLLGAFFIAAFLLVLASLTPGNYRADTTTGSDSLPENVMESFRIDAPFNQSDVHIITDAVSPYQSKGFISKRNYFNSSNSLANRNIDATIPVPPSIECDQDAHYLLLDGKIALTNVRWRVPSNGNYGCGTAIPHLRQTGHFWFFNSQNIELTCKALNALAINNTYWIFCGALTNVEWWMDAIDNANPSVMKRFYNAPNTMASFADTAALTPGPNAAPYFEDFSRCGTLYEMPAGGGGSLGLRVRDINNDPLDLNWRILSGDGLQIIPDWQNPISETQNGVEIRASISWPQTPGEFWMAFEVTDNTTLLDPVCTIGIRTH